MKKFRFEPWLWVLALLLALGMVLTLLYGGKGTSRHGYGLRPAVPPAQHLPADPALVERPA